MLLKTCLLLATSLTILASPNVSLNPALSKAPMPTSRGPAVHRGSPNVIMIVMDDIGFSDLGCYGSEIHTPNIDALAEGGLRYNRFDTKAVCSTTRAALLTGRNSQTIRMGFLASSLKEPDTQDNGPDKGELPINVETLAGALKNADYSTMAVGKWHLAPQYDETPPGKKLSWPLQRGFDHFYGFIDGNTDQYKPELVQDNAHISAPTNPDYHLSVDLVDHAILGLDANRRAAQSKPQFLYPAFGAAHSPIQVPRPYIDAYGTTYQKGWDVTRQQRFAKMKQLGIIPKFTELPIFPGPRLNRSAIILKSAAL